MTTRQLKDSNWTSARKSIISKYNKNGDGNFDQSEVEGIIDDYMGSIFNHQSLQGANKSQGKIIIFGAIMIVLLSFSNLGTGLAAANISKDIKIIDYRMTAAGDGGALKTETSLRKFEANAKKAPHTLSRGMQEVDDSLIWSCIACMADAKVEALVLTMRDQGQANVEVVEKSLDLSKILYLSKILNLRGDMYMNRQTLNKRRLGGESKSLEEVNEIEFPDVKIKLVVNDAECTKGTSKESVGVCILNNNLFVEDLVIFE